MTYVFDYVKCKHCKKEFLVERQLIGTDHTVGLLVTCKECARRAIEERSPYTEAFKKQHPVEYEEIKKWATSAETIKIVINDCYGGFSLSNEALLLLVKRNADCITEMKVEEYTRYVNRFLMELEPFKDAFQQQRGLLYKDGCVYFFNRCQYSLRASKDLVEVVEELGERANGPCAKLKIVEVPAGIEWTIEEYDGNEWVAEKHRVWM